MILLKQNTFLLHKSCSVDETVAKLDSLFQIAPGNSKWDLVHRFPVAFFISPLIRI